MATISGKNEDPSASANARNSPQFFAFHSQLVLVLDSCGGNYCVLSDIHVMRPAAAVVHRQAQEQQHACKPTRVFMSQPGSPLPCYDHPGFQAGLGAPFAPTLTEVERCCFVPILVPVLVPYPIAPLVPGLSPAEVGTFLHYQAALPTRLQSEELQSFVGWAL